MQRGINQMEEGRWKRRVERGQKKIKQLYKESGENHGL
jgi:hypothetical protein